MENHYKDKYQHDPTLLRATLIKGMFTSDFCSFLVRQNEADEAIKLIEVLQGKTVGDKLSTIESIFERRCNTYLSAIKDHSVHLYNDQQRVEDEETREKTRKNPSPEEMIFPGQKASMVINCYKDLENI